MPRTRSGTSYRETTGGGLGAKLPAGRGWTTSPPTETTLQAVGDGLYVRVEAIAFLDADEELDDVANRLLAVLAKNSQGVWDGFGSAATFGGRDSVVKEIQVEHEDGSFEERVLVVIDDGDGAAVVVWLGGSYESFESSVVRVADTSGAWLVPTLAAATVNPQRLAGLRNADAAERELAAAAAQKEIRPYKPRRPGRAGALQDLADQLDPRRGPDGR